MEDLYARVAKKGNLPTTSFASPKEFLQVYQLLSQNADSIIHISVTAGMSGGMTRLYRLKK